MDRYYNKSSEEVLSLLQTTREGLKSEELGALKEKYGSNELVEGARKSIFRVFMEQFKDFLVMILIVAAIVSGVLGKLESAIVIIVVIMLNAILGTVQHVKAQKSLDALKALASPMAKVKRDGNATEIPSKDLMVGDLMLLDAGDFISADGRIIENYNLQVNESSLTGEAESVLKSAETISATDISLGDRKNMVFSGSFVTYGRAEVIVTNIGMSTEIGKIANLLENAQEKKTPLQVSLDQFGKKLAVIILIICGIILTLNIVKGASPADAFMFAISLAVAAIPEALSSIVTIVLALGTQKMAKENAIVRKLHAVESLGGISVICSDKTGTLTQNKMTVQKLFVNGEVIETSAVNKENELEHTLTLMSLLCNDAITRETKEIGDPTEVALVDLGELYGLDELVVREKYPRLAELAFDSDRKLMTTAHKLKGEQVAITKGAFDVILGRCDHIQTAAGIRPITEEDKAQIKQINRVFSEQSLRVLAFAYRPYDSTKALTLEDENHLTFLGLIAMMDPPRVESAQAVADCIKAGIKPVMITGDHKITASAIAKQIGILNSMDEAIEGKELDALSDEELRNKVDQISVYARVSPEHKIRIVKAWQDNGNVVAMTGDGVNDAPALKQADIGVAMGITGTEVAKDAASMILTDDNFSTIVKAISNGRNIYANIKNAIKFLLSGNTAGILAVLYCSLLALPNPFVPLHLLFINLVTDSLPAIAIGVEPYRKDIMKEKPRKMDEPLLSRSFALEVLFEGILISCVTLVAFYMGKQVNHLTASTMAFSTLCLARLFHGLNCRGKASLFQLGVFSNKASWLATLLGVVLWAMIMTIKPLMSIFEIASLSKEQFISIGMLSLVPLVVIQLIKLILGAQKVRSTSKN
ncbi:cation-translocating P-type ATPase [Cellulosilyticum lentocellum]|uniref:ATPase, P-type (Transporting), HAD superfamily, subfamily IC n=1 Tax=Cellulosilyticum lentocellum (strain ATCC 49066 / DSM 5427 / NCIMB 11756 / RHM5) TaxID=642492 RepID=F2JI10_CELLD|nr:cation-translocating P-type ATPase [Cellulosilyticum lentocellum]ADZ81954.1 ATPase, P-type (transporting), HAD superfamily, subfamily IC [Cellulosilyticum lentocellum DSM 5427]